MTLAPTLSADPARMRPLYFEGRFGWLHQPPASAAPMRTGVVLCGALAQEEVCTRYGMMLLADLIAASGRPVLRFDYLGTGDSADAALSCASMIADIIRAVDALRQEAGVASVVLCGLRLGATLAVQAATALSGLAGIVLLAPIVSGAAYMRDLGVSVRFSPLALLDPVPPAGSDAAMNTNGFRWSRSLRDDVRALDLAAVTPPDVPLLVAAPHGSGRTDAATAAWRDAGHHVHESGFADYPAFMRDPTTHVMPEVTFAAVAAWIDALPQPTGEAPRASVDVRDTLSVGRAVETPLWIDGNFGILCRPAPSVPASGVAALMLHEGSTHHIGNGGAHVALARRLAARGHASLRVDLSGVGDTPAPAGTRRAFSNPDRMDEALATANALADHAPGGIVVSGLCSGAEMAFHAAVEHPAIAASVLANIPSIGWEQAEDGDVPPPARRTLRSSWRAVRAGAWRRILRGEIRLIDAARGLRSRTRRGPDSRAEVMAQMRELAARGATATFVFSDDDPGLGEVRRQLDGDIDIAPVRIEVLDRADHHFNAFDTRRRYEAIYERTIDDLAQRHATAERNAMTGAQTGAGA